MKPLPIVRDAEGRVIGMVAHLHDGRWKARPLRGFPVRRPERFRTRQAAVEWILAVAASRCLPLEVS